MPLSGGWAGAIREVDQGSAPPTYLIEWGRHTLDHMHPVYRKRCERDGLEPERMWLGEDDIEPDTGGPAVIEQPTNITTRPLNQKDQDDRVRIALGLTSGDPLPVPLPGVPAPSGRGQLPHGVARSAPGREAA